MSELCTGITASWCPNHGDCTCPWRDGDEDKGRTFDSPQCPLHAEESDHAEVDMRDVLAVAFETDGGGCDHSEPACSGCLADIAIRTIGAGRAL